ncbi:MAG: polynucleotide adenylyltransferase PcnB, partial [Gammaproteobacteria bacterium]|nr:polynucleotide adenylyltransferase PcnB [Gammaproteobacteria bacterium]
SDLVRFQEDPVRMLRAIRFAAKLDFKLEPVMAEQIVQLGSCLENVPAARLFEEVLKLFMHGHALKTYELLREYRIFKYLFADTDKLVDEFPEYLDNFIRQAMINTDKRVLEDKPVTPAYLFAVLLWGPVRQQAELLQEQDMSALQALQIAGNEVVEKALIQVGLSKRFSLPMREIWQMQARLMMRKGKRPFRLMEHPRFRASYDFMLLRQEVGEPIAELCNWWTEFQAQDDAGRQRMARALNKPVRRKAPYKNRQHKQSVESSDAT